MQRLLNALSRHRIAGAGREEEPRARNELGSHSDAGLGRHTIARNMKQESEGRPVEHRLFLLRALVGLEAYVKQLGTVANWRRIFVEEIEAAPESRG